MSINLTTSNNSNDNNERNNAHTAPTLAVTTNSLYETRTLMCKNNCGYYGNSIQYEGYCSICYRKLRAQKQNYLASSSSTSNFSYDDTSSLLPSSFSTSSLSDSHSFSSHFSVDDYKTGRKENEKKNQPIWNDNSNFNKFQFKKESRRSGTQSSSNALKQFLKRPTTSTIAAAVDSAVNKVVDKSVSMLNASTDLLNENQMSNLDFNLIEFNQCLNRLVTSPSTSSTITSSMLVNNTNTNNNASNDTSLASLNEFEEHFKLNFQQLHSELNKQMKQFVDRFIEKLKRNDAPTNIANSNKHSEIIQEFYKKIYKFITGHASLRTFLDKLNAHLLETSQTNAAASNTATSSAHAAEDSAEKLYEAIMIMIESFVTNNIYDYVFPVIMSEFEDQDMRLQKRIRSFYWITNDMIGTCIDENSIFYRESYEEAINYIVEMDSKRTAHEKMLCITECSKNIYKAINISVNIKRNISEANAATTPTLKADEDETRKNRSVASADDYLPAFIYIVLKANPTMLYSNMNFISRFAFEKRVLQGEHAYHFCSLNAIITHIENLNAQHLNMTQEKFEDYCNGLMDMNSSTNVLKLIQSNLKILSELKDKQKLLRQETKKLHLEMSSFKDQMSSKFLACLDKNQAKYTVNINGYERRNLIDDNLLNEQQSLPQPLKPQSLAISASNTNGDAN